MNMHALIEKIPGEVQLKYGLLLAYPLKPKWQSVS